MGRQINVQVVDSNEEGHIVEVTMRMIPHEAFIKHFGEEYRQVITSYCDWLIVQPWFDWDTKTTYKSVRDLLKKVKV